ncbi:hypothetical protein QJS66_20880 [Kocuria rhizophila]|nr:hypothetical protein QJS66_20880 [Kocuria rhizophila]
MPTALMDDPFGFAGLTYERRPVAPRQHGRDPRRPPPARASRAGSRWRRQSLHRRRRVAGSAMAMSMAGRAASGDPPQPVHPGPGGPRRPCEAQRVRMITDPVARVPGRHPGRAGPAVRLLQGLPAARGGRGRGCWASSPTATRATCGAAWTATWCRRDDPHAAPSRARWAWARTRPRALLAQRKIEKLPLVDGADRLTGLVTVKDFAEAEQYPLQPRQRGAAARQRPPWASSATAGSAR